LSSRLQRATGCAVFMVFAERLPIGAGYRMHVERLSDGALDEAALNGAIERAIRRCPEQYLWGYDRYRKPKGLRVPAARPVMEEND